MSRVLLTGFEPFGPHARNPTADAIEALSRDPTLRERGVSFGLLPVGRAECLAALEGLLDRDRPDVALLTGLAATRGVVTVERVAINCWWPPGASGTGEAIVDDGPDGLFSTLPLDAVVGALQGSGVRAEVSDTAGTYACNLALYRALLDAATGRRPGLRAGFVHVPPTPETSDPPRLAGTLPLDALVRALRAAALRLAEAGPTP
jgi:pyroglutamyl-peptidase